MVEKAARRGAEIAKTTRPAPRAAVNRTRLFRLLQKLERSQLVWIGAPAGAGKTTLASTYLAANRRPHVWYALDAADGAPATFFHYLAKAARSKKPLPALTPDRLPRLDLYTRRFFEELGRRLPAKAVIVFDDFHTVPNADAIGELIATGRTYLRPQQRILVLSREAPPPSLACLEAKSALTHLDEGELKLTLGETQAIVRLRRRNERVSRTLSTTLHERTRGWAAGLVLLVERIDEVAIPQLMRDYVASEYLALLPIEARRILACVALPSRPSHAMAVALGGPDAKKLLDDLARRGSFVTRTQAGSYELHPLLRDALLARADELDEAVRREAARLCVADGDDEVAVDLLAGLADWGALLGFVQTRAPILLMHGRQAALEGWLSRLPLAMQEEDPWALYWRGVCRDVRPGGGAGDYRAAFARFEARGDVVGQLSALAGSVMALVFQYDDLTALDDWIAEFERLWPKRAALPPGLRDIVMAAIVNALNYRRLDHPRQEEWLGYAIDLLQSGEGDPVGRLQLAYVVSSNRWWMGDQARALMVGDLMRRFLRAPNVPVLLQVFGRGIDAWSNIQMGDFAAGRAAVEDGMRLANEHGIVWWNFLLGTMGTYGALLANDPTLAKQRIADVEACLEPSRRRLETANHAYMLGWAALVDGELDLAMLHAGRGARLCAELGTRLPESLCHMVAAEALIGSGAFAEAGKAIEAATEAGSPVSRMVEAHTTLSRAHLALASGDRDGATRFITHAFGLGRRGGLSLLVSFAGRAQTMADLCALALDEEIEVDTAREVIKRRPCAAYRPPPSLERWPWHVRIRVLGRFAVEIGGLPLRARGKVQVRPLELLQRLAAQDGGAAPESLLQDAMWPDADGDRAERAFTVTLHRLRALLGDPALVQRHAGVVSLDRARVFSDVWAIEDLLGRLTRTPGEHPRLRAQLHGLYRGPLLEVLERGRSDWAHAARGKLAARVQRALT